MVKNIKDGRSIMRFKIGDTVSYPPRDIINIGWCPQGKFVIERISISPDNKFIYWPESGHGYYEDSLELVERSKITDWKKVIEK